MCGEELRAAKEQLEVAQAATKQIHDDAKTAKEEPSKFEAEYGARVGSRRDEVSEMTKQLRQ